MSACIEAVKAIKEFLAICLHYPKFEFDTKQFRLIQSQFGWGGEKIYAIVETGGKQYKVALKQTIEVERLNVPKGNTVELETVLFIGNKENTLIGNPTIRGAKVIATSLGEVKGDKIIVFKYKSKVRYRRKTGHRQIYTRLLINAIIRPVE